MGCVYMRITPSGKTYIGQTSYTEKRRWHEHCYAAFKENHPDYNTPLSRAIRKYGPDGFECIILEDNVKDRDDLKKLEVYWISYYDTFRNGLNATRGGDGHKNIENPEQLVELWDQGHCVRDISILTNICSSTILSYLNLSPKEAGKRGPVYKTRNSVNRFGDYQYGRALPVNCYDVKTGILVKSFSSLYKAAEFLNLNCSTAIKRAIDGRMRSAFGYYWTSGEAKEKLSEEELEHRRRKQTKIKEYVVCIERNEMYSDAIYAQKVTGICYRSISFACRGQQKTAGGYHWRYATEEDKKNMKLLKEEKPFKTSHNAMAVLCVETNKTYVSATQASKDLNVSIYKIIKCCRNSTETVNGLHWRYIKLEDE